MKPIFSRNDDVDKIAFLNWRIFKGDDIINMLNLADGFMLSAINQAKLCLSDNSDKSADVLIFPILANANHGIELYLKAITWTLNILLKSKFRVEGNHNIKQILKTVQAKIKLYKGLEGLKDFNDSITDLDSYVDELFDKIGASDQNDKMDFSRYPITKGYGNHFYVNVIGNVEIDLENFVYRFEKIRESLDSVSSYLYHQELNQDWY